MKSVVTVFALLLSVLTFGQSAKEFLENGIAKHKVKDYEGAIKDYSKAIKEDKNYTDAYYNKGTCELALNDLKSAKKDFDKAIEIDPKYVKAYYSRATVLVSQEKYSDALPDLDKVIELDATTPNALSLRGQIRVQSGDKKGACEDFTKAKENGDSKADRYLQQFCGNKQQAGESLMLHWPEEENWKVGDDQENSKMHVLDLIHSNETLNTWTELGNMTSIKGVTGIAVDKAMNLMFEQSKQESPKAKLTFIEKDENAAFPWIVFTIESPNSKTDKTPESQLWYIVQGKEALYTNFIAVKQATISKEQKEKFAKFLKTAKVVSK